MPTPEVDSRSSERRARDEQIADEPRLAPLELPADVPSLAVEVHLDHLYRRSLAVAGIVEMGLVRPLDPTTKLVENSRVIIVAVEQM